MDNKYSRKKYSAMKNADAVDLMHINTSVILVKFSIPKKNKKKCPVNQK